MLLCDNVNCSMCGYKGIINCDRCRKAERQDRPQDREETVTRSQRLVHIGTSKEEWYKVYI